MGIHEPKTTLSQLVERAEFLAGERPRSMARPHVLADDFDELPDDVADAFGAR